MTTTVIRAARWVDGAAGEVRSPATVVVVGNRIESVDPAVPPQDP
ncbi:amidohydrolase, partial [Enterococcus faecium]